MMSKKGKSKEKEKQLLNNFLDTKIGNNWYFAKKVIDKLGYESPDFLLKTQDNKTLGVEITEFYVEHIISFNWIVNDDEISTNTR